MVQIKYMTPLISVFTHTHTHCIMQCYLIDISGEDKCLELAFEVI